MPQIKSGLFAAAAALATTATLAQSDTVQQAVDDNAARGSVVIFNDIAALAELHCGTSAKPHHALHQQLTATFK